MTTFFFSFFFFFWRGGGRREGGKEGRKCVLLLTQGYDVAQLLENRCFLNNCSLVTFQCAFDCCSEPTEASTDDDDLNPSFGIFGYRRRHRLYFRGGMYSGVRECVCERERESVCVVVIFRGGEGFCILFLDIEVRSVRYQRLL